MNSFQGPKPFVVLEDTEIDDSIKPLVEALNSHPLLCTWGSCEGHAASDVHDSTYVGLCVKGLDGVQVLVDVLNAVNARFESDDEPLWIDCGLNWCSDVNASTDFANSPDWISFELRFESLSGSAIGAARLSTIAEVVAAVFGY